MSTHETSPGHSADNSANDVRIQKVLGYAEREISELEILKKSARNRIQAKSRELENDRALIAILSDAIDLRRKLDSLTGSADLDQAD